MTDNSAAVGLNCLSNRPICLPSFKTDGFRSGSAEYEGKTEEEIANHDDKLYLVKTRKTNAGCRKRTEMCADITELYVL